MEVKTLDKKIKTGSAKTSELITCITALIFCTWLWIPMSWFSWLLIKWLFLGGV